MFFKFLFFSMFLNPFFKSCFCFCISLILLIILRMPTIRWGPTPSSPTRMFTLSPRIGGVFFYVRLESLELFGFTATHTSQYFGVRAACCVQHRFRLCVPSLNTQEMCCGVQAPPPLLWPPPSSSRRPVPFMSDTVLFLQVLPTGHDRACCLTVIPTLVQVLD